MKDSYYHKVKSYYNEDSKSFEERYWENQTLQRIRKSFRKVTTQYPFKTLLEIGFGPGLDVIYFSKQYPERAVFGIDISDGMFNWATMQKEKEGVKNLSLAVGSIEDIERQFPQQEFDQIIVYFGALNTVENISEVQHYIKKSLAPNGTMVLTFVNKWYLMSILKPLVKLKFKESRRRLNKVWGGYSPSKFLESRCYSYKEIKKHFNQFEIIKKRGYSIFYPAWYENRITKKYPKTCNFFWNLDLFLQKTPFWNLGEYSLYVFKNRS